MNYENLKIEIEDGIALVTVSREKALNALNAPTFSELKQFFGTDALQIEGLKGVVVTGAGERAFVAGADISEFNALDAAGAGRLAKRGQDIFLLIENFPKVVVAAINGFALGGGCELAMACHLRVAGEKAKFGQPEVNLGLTPGYGGTQRLVQLVGKSKALELLLTADIIGAAEAHQLGLVNHLVPSGEEVAKAKELVQKIAAKAPVAVAMCIQSVNAYFAEGGAAGFEKEVESFEQCAATEDFREGAAAFMEKRKANFQGK